VVDPLGPELTVPVTVTWFGEELPEQATNKLQMMATRKSVIFIMVFIYASYWHIELLGFNALILMNI